MAKYLNPKMIFLTTTPCCSPSLVFLKGSETDFHYKILANYNGQAELLLSLQIPPDYFPYQFKQRGLYDYLTHINKYLVTEGAAEQKQKLGNKIQDRINQLIGKVTTFGPSLWNEDLYAGGLVNRNVQFWNTKSADYLFLEQFILDDSSDPMFLIQSLPKHSHLAVTNFRAARDPYSIFGENVYKHFRKSAPKNKSGETNQLASKLLEYYKSYSKISLNSLYRSARYMNFWVDFCNDVQAKSKPDTNSSALQYLFHIPSSKEQLFAPFGDKEIDKKIAQKFFEEIFTDEEREWLNKSQEGGGGDKKLFEMNYLKENGKDHINNNDSVCPSVLQSQFEKVHHPALEHQTMKGSSPVSEGSQKELFVYLAQLAIALDKITKTGNFSSVFKDDSRQQFIKQAWTNAVEIAKNYRERLKNVRSYLKKIKVVDEGFDPEQKKYSKTNSKTLAIISYPPSQLGAGDAAIQTVSKYPFLYTELGLKEIIPKNLINSQVDEDLLGVDDNGWWWRLGDFNFSSKGLDSFSGNADSIILLATEDDWNILNAWDSPKLRSLKTLLKTQEDKYLDISNYHLWNEGLRSPIALNLLLDVLVKSLTKQFAGNNNGEHKDDYQKALNWGGYWEKTFAEGKISNGKNV